MAAPSIIITVNGTSYYTRRPVGESPSLWQFNPVNETWQDATKVRDLPDNYSTQDAADAIAYHQRTDQATLDTEAAKLV